METEKDLYLAFNLQLLQLKIFLCAAMDALGGRWCGCFHEALVQILSNPINLRPVAVIPIGYPNENPKSFKEEKATPRGSNVCVNIFSALRCIGYFVWSGIAVQRNMLLFVLNHTFIGFK
jgi:hypothetical protein